MLQNLLLTMQRNLFQTAVSFFLPIQKVRGCKLTREELKEQINELMRQYADEEIDGSTYAQKMMELTTSAQYENDED